MDRAELEMIGKYCFKAKVGDHEFYIDLSKAQGGEGRGPSPPAYLLAAIGGCIGIVSKFLAEQEGVKIEDVKMEICGEHDIRGIVMPEKYDSKIKGIHIKIWVKGEPKDKVREIIERAKEVCPVCKTIKEGSEVSLEIVE